MIRKTWIINLVLAFVAMSFFIKAYQSWHQSNLSPKGESDMALEDRFNLPEFRWDKKSKNEYEAVAARNLFSPDRSEPKSEKNVRKSKPENEKTISEAPAPKFVEQNYKLYGIIYQKEKTRALLKAPVKDKNENPVRWISVGDKLNEFTVSNIHPDRIVITDGSAKYGLPIHKEKKTENMQAPVTPVVAPVDNTRKTSETPTVIGTGAESSKDSTPKSESKDGDIIIDGNKKYKIVETPFGKSRIRID